VRGENIFAASRVPWPQVSREQVLARQPQAIVIAGDASQLPAVERYWQNQLKISLLRYMATGLNARAHVLSSPQNNSVLRSSR
jgi:ABC-type Fe3+-hydroxamate transport system substrate-binding protein